ncbi:F-box domain-containing protein [Mycena sanguinolenta]|uniref:F-box domain-containing protein n=1 Tax=Mycena sanguinolenta TaxID=230812 RepID=A0A8H6YEM2_9AGAR|nr:F-box domain-containing protein [Mycena sanguinolenta]
MAPHFPMYAVLPQQTERIRRTSAAQSKELIAESDSKVESLRNQIGTLESRVAALIERRVRERAGDALRSLVAPIRTLPVELLAEIFLLTIRELDLSGSRYVDFGREYLHIKDAFRVSHICRQWRQIANGTPRLWTGPIRVDFHRRRNEWIYADGLETWLARSAPLSVPIIIMGPHHSWLPESKSRLIEILLCIAARWRSLRFFSHVLPASFVQRLAGCRLDSLEELVLRGVERDNLHFDPTTILSFSTAPRLRSVTSYWACGIPMPWAQLTNISFGNFGDVLSPETFRNVFSQCMNVVKASINIEWSAVGFDALVLNQLRILSVTWYGDEGYGMQFLDCLSAPALDELNMYLEGGRSDMQWAEATFTAFQRRSPNITKLRITGRDCLSVPSQALITALRYAPSLTHFCIEDCPNAADEDFCHALCYIDDAEPLVPRLHTLAVGEFGGDLSQEGLANMIASRWWSDAELGSRSRPPLVARWRQIRLRGDSIEEGFNFDSEFRDAMYALQEGGLDVDFVHRYGSWRLDSVNW